MITAAGVVHVNRLPWRAAGGGGVAVFDCAADGMPELFIACGENNAKLFFNRSPRGGAFGDA